MNIYRDNQVCISNQTKWMLGRIVRAANSSESSDVPEKVDALAERILREWVGQKHPELNVLWVKREAINLEAVDAVKPKLSEPAVPF